MAYDTDNVITVKYNEKPDQLQCWNQTELLFQNQTDFDSSLNLCGGDDLPTDRLFKYFLPLTITSIAILTTVFGLLLSLLFQKKMINYQTEKFGKLKKKCEYLFTITKN